MTNNIADVANAHCIMVIGSNTTVTHPIIGLEVKKAVRRGAKLIVINPKEIELCQLADVWLRLKPGTDVAVMNGIMKVILEERLQDEAYIKERCEGFENLTSLLSKVNVGEMAKIAGVPEEDLAKAARIYATQRPSSILYTLGVTEHTHGTNNVWAISNLALLTGNVGVPGGGVNPLRGANNVQGACDMGCLPTHLPGYQTVNNPDARRRIESLWEVPFPETAGLSLGEMFSAARAGKIKAMYILGENPVLSDPNSGEVEEGLRRLEFLVVQDIFLTETALLADVVLPGASFAEKEGTFTNTERRVQRVRQAIRPVGDSRPDWRIIGEIARRMGGKGFAFEHPSQVMEEIARVTPIYGGISYQRLKGDGIQWPCPDADHPGTPILHVGSFARGKAKFIPVDYAPPAEEPDGKFPLILTTGRARYHFHTGTMTRRVKGLNLLHSEELVQINPCDAESLGIEDGDPVMVTSRRGEVEARASLTEAVGPGTVFMTFHFGESPANRLTNDTTDPISKVPELKVCAVRLNKVQKSGSLALSGAEREPKEV